MKKHKISWLNMPGYKPETWNPIVGCSKVSPGCDNCYAEKQAFIRAFNPNTPQYKNVVVKHPLDPRYREWNGMTELVNSALAKPLSWKNKRMIFICSMSDLFYEKTPFEWIDSIFSIMSDLDQHIYVILTKRPEVVLEFFCWKILRSGFNWRPKDNIWFGVTAENQHQANKRIPILLKIPAAKRFVSIEPMLGPVDIERWLKDNEWEDLLKSVKVNPIHGLDWVICGGESGPKARPMHPDWVRSVRDQCKEANAPFFFKQWGAYAEKMMYGPECKKGPVGIDGWSHHNWPLL